MRVGKSSGLPTMTRKRQFLFASLCSLVLVGATFSVVFVKSLRPAIDVVLAPGFIPLRWLGAEGPFHDPLPVMLGFLLNVLFYAIVTWLLLLIHGRFRAK